MHGSVCACVRQFDQKVVDGRRSVERSICFQLFYICAALAPYDFDNIFTERERERERESNGERGNIVVQTLNARCVR
jgi:hypothetical protein